MTEKTGNDGQHESHERTEDELASYIKTVDKFHDLLYGKIRVKAFQKLILLDSHLRFKYPRGQSWNELKHRARQPWIQKTYDNYLGFAQTDKREIDYARKFLCISERTARDYVRTLSRLNNPIAYLY